MKAETLSEFQIGPRTVIRPRDRIAVSCGKRSGPTEPALASRGRFSVLRLWRRGKRVYADCWDDRSGGVYCLYLAGPVHRSRCLPSVKIRPYRVRKIRRAK